MNNFLTTNKILLSTTALSSYSPCFSSVNTFFFLHVLLHSQNDTSIEGGNNDPAVNEEGAA